MDLLDGVEFGEGQGLSTRWGSLGLLPVHVHPPAEPPGDGGLTRETA